MILDIASWVFLAAGGAFVLIGGIGVLRMPDFFTRMHAAGITDTMGAGLIVVGLMLQAGSVLLAVKLGMVAFFLLITSATSGHALARSALYFLKPVTDEPEEAQS